MFASAGKRVEVKGVGIQLPGAKAQVGGGQGLQIADC